MKSKILQLLGSFVVAQGARDGSASTDLAFVFPPSIKDDGVYHRDALFGTPFSKSEILGRIVYIPGDACNETSYKSANFKTGDLPMIFLLNRGECPFEQKTRLAQAHGASGVVFVDNKCYQGNVQKWGVLYNKWCGDGMPETILPYMGGVDEGHDVRIPAFIVTKFDGQILKDCYLKANDKTSSEDFVGLKIADACKSQDKVVVKMMLSVPPIAEVVDYELWLSPTHIPEEISVISKVAEALNGFTTFTPRYAAFKEHIVGCGNNACPNECIYMSGGDGYCLVGTKLKGKVIEGKTILEETVQQMCVWETAKKDESTKRMWWYYVMEFKRCLNAGTDFKDCSSKAMQLAVPKQSDKNEIASCVEEEKKTFSIMAKNVELLVEHEVFTTSLTVNGVRVDFSLSGTFVARAVCDGFAAVHRPKLCSCVPDTDNVEQLDTCLKAQCFHDTSKPFNCPNSKKCVADLEECVGGSSGLSGVAIFFIVLGVAGALGGVFVYQRRVKKQMQEEVRDILSEYVPLEAFSSQDNNSQYARFNTSAEGNDTVGVI